MKYRRPAYIIGIILILQSYAFAFNYNNIIKKVCPADRSPAWYNQSWMTNSQYSPIFEVLDTESSLGRYALMTKTITVKDIIKFHGHACDGLLVCAAGLKIGLSKLFPSGIIDRTDLRVITKNSPCFVDTCAYLTGGRINFGTLEIDNSLGWSWIIQRISTKKAVKISLKKEALPEEVEEMEKKIRGGKYSIKDIDRCRNIQWKFAKKILSLPPNKAFRVTILENFAFPEPTYPKVGKRGDILHKNEPYCSQKN